MLSMVSVGSQVERLFGVAWKVLFLSMLFVPTAYLEVKAILLAISITGVGFALLRKRLEFRLHPAVGMWFLVIVCTGVLFMLRGYLNGGPGALRVGTVYLLWPLIFAIFIGVVPSVRTFQSLTRVMVIGGIAVGLYGVMYVSHATGNPPHSFYVELEQGQEIGVYDGFVEYNMYSISTLIFMTPFLISALLHGLGREVHLSYGWLWTAYGLCLASSLLSGRRSLWLILVITPIIYLLMIAASRLQNVNLKKMMLRLAGITVFSAMVFVIVSALFNLDPRRMNGYIVSGFPDMDTPLQASQVTGSEAATQDRYLQARALLQGWLESPWFGHGHGTVAGIIRSREMPWAYELQYLALLYHTGIVGTLSYAGCIGWIYWQGVRTVRRLSTYGGLMIPLLTGLSGFLIANATNPYLLKFDFMWTVFLPLAVINRFLLEEDRKERCHDKSAHCYC